MTPDDFIAAIGPAARASMLKTKIPASFVIAEAALESGWGRSELATQADNLFGVKASKPWQGATLAMQTAEVLHGQRVIVPALWRKYPSWQAAIDDHAAFLLQERYRAAFSATDSDGFARAVAAAGYATDPQYADKIIGLIHSRNLVAYDHA